LKKLHKKILVLGASVAIAFVVNGFRVAIMALFANAQDEEGLHYWHVGEGSLIFMMISVGLLGLLCWFLLRQEEPSSDEVLEQ
jgi:exosortase/archaeosortase family protein